MPGIVDVPGIEVYGKGRGRFPLPCGFVDSRGEPHRMVTMRELSGEEEDLMDDDEIPVTERTPTSASICRCSPHPCSRSWLKPVGPWSRSTSARLPPGWSS